MRRRIFVFTVFLFCFVWPDAIYAKQYYFNHITTDDGLSHNEVTSVIQCKNGFMWFATNDGLSRFDGRRFKTYRHRSGDYGINAFWSLCEDSSGNIWSGSNGITKYDPYNDTLEYFTLATQQGERPEKRIKSILCDKNGLLYFMEQERGIFCFDPQADKLYFFALPTIITTAALPVAVNITAIWSDDRSDLYAGTESGDVFILDKKNKQYIRMPDNSLKLKDDPVQKIVGNNDYIYIGYQYSGVIRFDRKNSRYESLPPVANGNKIAACVLDMMTVDNSLWIATENGLYIYDQTDNSNTHIVRDFFDQYSLSDDALYSLGRDSDGGIWIGTYFHGINYLPPGQYTFVEKYYPVSKDNSISGKAVREMCQNPDGDIWIGTEDGGLNRFNPTTKTFKQYNSANIHGLAVIGNNLYVGIYFQGLAVIDIRTGAISHYKIFDEKHNIQFNSIYSICEDRRNRIWIGTKKGVYLFDPRTKQFIKQDMFGDIFAHNILSDSNGNIWISTIGDGVICHTPTGKTINYSEDIGSSIGASFKQVNSAYEDSKHNIWFSTQGIGIVKFDPGSHSFRQYYIADGIPDGTVYKPIEDNYGNLWFGTNKGLVCLDGNTDKIRVYTKKDGLPTNQFNYNSSFKDRSGKLYFGTTAGLIVADPMSIAGSDKFPEIQFTGFHIFNDEVAIGAKSPLKQSMIETRAITLRHNQNTFSVDLAVMRYFAPQMNSCYVKLEGFDRDWVYIEDNLKASYANLSPGKYQLKVRVPNIQSEWQESDKSLTIRIRPPFWASHVAFVIYFFLVCAAVYMAYRITNRKLERKRMLWEDKIERQKETEAYQAKIDFFINLAHEIKTPLTLIKVPLDLLLQRETDDPKIRESLETMNRNMDRLLNLTNQILDFKKIESKAFSMTFSQVNINRLLQSVYERFKLIAEQKNINMTLYLPNMDVVAQADEENLTKIISNLFINALKFCSHRIDILLMVSPGNENFVITVDNDGEVIPRSMQDKVFEAFFQLNPRHNAQMGRGIGLSLARSLAQLHGGYLSLDISAGTNKFILSLPLAQTASGEMAAESEPPADTAVASEIRRGEHTLNILIVEDDREMLDFIEQRLSEYYNVYKANNGTEAIRILDKTEINLVVSDVMMHRMNGMALLKAIKSDVYYSHIPVILLTARSGLQSKIEGLELGADAYIEKPFSFEHLRAQISNLLNNRRKIREQFSHQPFTQSQSMAMTKADEQFLQKLNRIIEENIQSPQLSVDLIADAVHMSRSSLHRKIKGISGQTPNDYIKIIKLKRAAVLLQEGNYRINEVSAATGFAKPSYFAKCFQEHFRVLPKDFANKTP